MATKEFTYEIPKMKHSSQNGVYGGLITLGVGKRIGREGEKRKGKGATQPLTKAEGVLGPKAQVERISP